MNRAKLISNLNSVNEHSFETAALDLFRYQYRNNSIYNTWVDTLNIKVSDINVLDDIPFLPISAFKNHEVTSQKGRVSHIFKSSGTTGAIPSQHFVFDINLYLKNAERIFSDFYQNIKDYCYLALLPNYLERSGSSLITMVDYFIKESNYSESGFYLYNHESLNEKLAYCQKNRIPTILFGVSFALLDYIEKYTHNYPELLIIETGGMKGRKKEMTKKQLQDLLSNGFGVEYIHSEYGMTELFSQAYSESNGLFKAPSSMNIVIKEITDPFNNASFGKTGIINIIDLANIDSCAFIETQDLGRLYNDGSFEVLGRLDEADIRGCNLMVSDL